MTGLAHKYPEACTEAGTPLADLALIQALHYSGAGPLPDPLRQELFRRVVVRPSFLTPELIAAAERAPLDPEEMRTIQLLKNTWIVQERTRTLLRTLLQHSLDHFNASEIWLEAEGQPILADCHPEYWSLDENMIRRPPGSDYSVNLIPGRWLERAFLKAFTDTRNQLPLYATAAVQIGEKRWHVTSVSTYQDSHFPVSELASTSSAFNAFPEYVHLTPGSDMNYLAPPHSLGIKFTLTLELARPDLLYTRYRQRLWLAYGLILSAAAAAMIGLVSAWRAFKKQLRLAEMTTNFVSSVSHELRAPLASVRLMAESLEQGRIADGDKRKDYFRMIVQESRRLSSLVENVLDFSRIQQGRKRYDFEPVDLLALVRETVKLMEPNAAERQVSLILLEPESCCGELQPSWNGQAVQEALTNLIDNAIKHSPAAEAVTIELKVLARDTGTQIQLVVGDKGPGIPAGEQKKIFEPFYRAGSELRRETKGVGIGLSIVRHIAEAHGGRVLVHSVVGQGSHFTLELPLRIESKMNADKLGFQSHDNG